MKRRARRDPVPLRRMAYQANRPGMRDHRHDPNEKMDLREAARLANERGLIGDYYSLSDDKTSELSQILIRTKWRQSAPSRDRGHSRVYAFHQALKRVLPKRAGYNDPRMSKALRASNHALSLLSNAYGKTSSHAYHDAADALEVAAEAYEEAGYMNDAVDLREKAQRARKSAQEKSRL